MTWGYLDNCILRVLNLTALTWRLVTRLDVSLTKSEITPLAPGQGNASSTATTASLSLRFRRPHFPNLLSVR